MTIFIFLHLASSHDLQVLAWIIIEMKARVPALTLVSSSLGSLLTGEVTRESAAKRPRCFGEMSLFLPLEAGLVVMTIFGFFFITIPFWIGILRGSSFLIHIVPVAFNIIIRDLNIEGFCSNFITEVSVGETQLQMLYWENVRKFYTKCCNIWNLRITPDSFEVWKASE